MNKQSFSTNKNILILTTPFRPNIGGVETHLDDLIEAGIKRGFNFFVLTYQPLVTKAQGKTIEIEKGFKVYRLPWLRMNLFLILEKYPSLEFIYLFPPLFLLGLIFMLFNQNKIKVIHAQGLVAGAIGVILGKIFGKKVIISTHSIYNFPKKGMYFNFAKFLFGSSNKVLCLSHQSKQEVVDLGIEPSKVEVFTYWVDQEIFHPFSKKESRKKIGENEESFICLFIGRLVKGKGIPELLESADFLKDKMSKPSLKFIIIGDGPFASLVDEASKRQTNIRFEGKVNNNELTKYYNAANVLLVPSTHEEGYGRVILEALSCGIPIIATNRGGVKEYINREIGILIDITAQNIKDSLLLLLNNPKKLKSMSDEAYVYAKIHFNKKNCQIIFRNYE